LSTEEDDSKEEEEEEEEERDGAGESRAEAGDRGERKARSSKRLSSRRCCPRAASTWTSPLSRNLLRLRLSVWMVEPLLSPSTRNSTSFEKSFLSR
jgi:hypothetical protein